MASKIEQMIDDIEEYINGCKYQPLSNTKIIVNKEDIDELLRELRDKTPDEIRRYQKIINNQEAIENEAKQKAKAIIAAAQERTLQMTNESEIMQNAYAEADTVIQKAVSQAETLMNNTVQQTNAMKASAVEYIDSLLAEVDALLTRAIDATNAHYDGILTEYTTLSERVRANRRDLTPPTPMYTVTGEGAQQGPEGIPTPVQDQTVPEAGSDDINVI